MAADQLAYNRAVADLAHSRGLSVALKNDVEQIPELVDDFGSLSARNATGTPHAALTSPSPRREKAVLHVEYQGPLDFGAESTRQGLSSMLKPLELGPARQTC